MKIENLRELALNLPGPYSIDPVKGMPSGGIETAAKVIRWGITVLFIGITLTSLIFFILGGIQWIISSGDKAKIEAARKRLVYSLIGLVVVFLSYFIINLVSQFFGVKLLNIPSR